MLAGELADATLARFLCSWLSPLQGRHGMGAFAPGETAPHQAVYTPRRIEALADVRATAVAAGGTSSLILLLNGEVHSCGGVLLHGLNAYWAVQIVARARARVWRDADGVGRSGGAEGHYHKSRKR